MSRQQPQKKSHGKKRYEKKEYKNNAQSIKLILLLGIIAYTFGAALFTYSFSQGPNNRNVSVDVTVNITDSLPEVLTVIIQDAATNITLNAGTYINVTCNGTIQDYNGGSSINNVSATFFHNVSPTNTSTPDDNNTHYTNSNCTYGSYDIYTRNVSCSFLVEYYANVGFWVCNLTVTDPYNFTTISRLRSNTNRTHLDELMALNVTTLIDYGNMAVGDTSTPQEANITNLGNMGINISVRGYGNASSDNLALYCEVGNITIENEKFNFIGGVDLTTYKNLSASNQDMNVTLQQQFNDSEQVMNTSYWLLYVPPNPFGRCNGTIVFQAERNST